MRSRQTYVTIVTFLVAGMFLVMKTKTDTIASQTTSENTASQVEGPELEKIIGKLRDKEIRKSSPKELVEAINRARMIAGANTLSDKDWRPYNCYKRDDHKIGWFSTSEPI